MPRLILTTWAILWCAAAGYSDVVTMVNGDRLTGTLVESDGKNARFKSAHAGTVAIPWAAVRELRSEKPVHVTLQDARILVGPVSVISGKIGVRSEAAGLTEVLPEEVLSIRSEEEEARFQAEVGRLRDPGILDLWWGTLDTGLSTTRGNADTVTLNLAAKAARTTDRDRTSVYFTSLFAENSTRRESETTANAVRGGLRYDVNLTPRFFTFGFTDFEFDALQDLDLRNVLGGGFGFHALRTDRTELQFFGGGSFNQEFFSNGLDRKSGEALVGQDLTIKLTQWADLSNRFVLFPNLTNPGEYRMNFDASATARFNSWLSWHITVSDRFLTNPKAGNQKNDLLLTTGIRISFGEERKLKIGSPITKILNR